MDMAMLDVAIGIIFVYVICSLACTALSEAIARMFKMRSRILFDGIRNLLDGREGDETTTRFYDHPLINGLMGGRGKAGSKGRERTAAIPPTFILPVLLDIALPPDSDHQEIATIRELKATIAKIENPRLRTILLSSVGSAGTDIGRAREAVASWFDEAMKQVTEWYKRRTQWVAMLCAVVVCVGLNVDTLAIGRALSTDSEMRASVVSMADEFAAQHESLPAATTAMLDSLRTEMKVAGMPIGWSSGRRAPAPSSDGFWSWLLAKTGGLLLSIAAVSVGGPFWFDLLRKLLNLRRPSVAESGDPVRVRVVT